MKLIRSATFQLTLSYLAVLMVLSIGFNVFLYQVSAAELVRNYRRPIQYNSFLLSPSTIDTLREQQLGEGQAHLQQNLVLLNLATLVIGGAISYWLARWTLRPVEEAMEAQGRFTADASHELRTPLTAMQTEIEVALRDKGLNKAEAVAMLRSNLEEIAKLRDLSDGLLKLTRPEQELTREGVDLADVAQVAVERLAKVAKQREIRLTADLKPAKTQGDQAGLVELAVILLDNAIKYSPAGSTVTLATKHYAKQAFLSVRDEGQGIKASDQPHIFERFYRADRSRSKETVDGYGLGLSIASQISRLHGGTIEVRSQVGKGSTFTLKLPGSA